MSRGVLDFSLWKFPATSPPFLNTGSCLMAKKVSTRRAWTADHVQTLKTLARKRTTAARIAQNIEANRGHNAAKGVQPGIITDSRA